MSLAQARSYQPRTNQPHTIWMRENLSPLLALLQWDEQPSKKEIEEYFNDMKIQISKIIERNTDDVQWLITVLREIAKQYGPDPKVYVDHEASIGRTLIDFLIKEEQKARENMYEKIQAIQHASDDKSTKIQQIYPLVQKLFNVSNKLLEQKIPQIFHNISRTSTEIIDVLQGKREKTSPKIKRMITITSIMLVWWMANNIGEPLSQSPKLWLSQVIWMSNQKREDYIKKIQDTYHIPWEVFLLEEDIVERPSIWHAWNTNTWNNIPWTTWIMSMNPWDAWHTTPALQQTNISKGNPYQTNTKKIIAHEAPSTNPHNNPDHKGKWEPKNTWWTNKKPLSSWWRHITWVPKLPKTTKTRATITSYPKKILMPTNNIQTFTLDNITLRYDHGARFYQVKKWDSVWEIRQKLKKYDNFSHLNNPRYSPWEIQADGKRKTREKTFAWNIPNKIEPWMRIPVPQSIKKRQLTERKLISSATQALENIINHEKYGIFVTSLGKKLWYQRLERTMLSFAIKESNIWANSLARYEALYRAYSYGIYHILTEEAKDGSPWPGLRALQNLGYTPWQVITDPVKAGERFRAYRAEKCKELVHSKNRKRKLYGKHPHTLFQDIVQLGKIYNGREVYGETLKEIFNNLSASFH